MSGGDLKVSAPVSYSVSSYTSGRSGYLSSYNRSSYLNSLSSDSSASRRSHFRSTSLDRTTSSTLGGASGGSTILKLSSTGTASSSYQRTTTSTETSRITSRPPRPNATSSFTSYLSSGTTSNDWLSPSTLSRKPSSSPSSTISSNASTYTTTSISDIKSRLARFELSGRSTSSTNLRTIRNGSTNSTRTQGQDAIYDHSSPVLTNYRALADQAASSSKSSSPCRDVNASTLHRSISDTGSSSSSVLNLSHRNRALYGSSGSLREQDAESDPDDSAASGGSRSPRSQSSSGSSSPAVARGIETTRSSLTSPCVVVTSPVRSKYGERSSLYKRSSSLVNDDDDSDARSTASTKSSSSSKSTTVLPASSRRSSSSIGSASSSSLVDIMRSSKAADSEEETTSGRKYGQSSSGSGGYRRRTSGQASSTSGYSSDTSSGSGSPSAPYGTRTKHGDLSVSGLVGLTNLGNTCFMNTVLQCLSNTKPLLDYCLKGEYLSEINTTRSTMKGALMQAFADLLKNMWSRTRGSDDTVNPQSFRNQVQKYAPRFAGYSQQDSQEFLRYLLEGLHEDVNKVIRKPRPITTDIEDRLSDEQKAKESWSRYLMFEDSHIQDLFVGQLKSTLCCTYCGYKSVTFDPFWDLSIPVTKLSGTCHLSSCLDLFTKEEVLDGDEQPFCSKCKQRRKCTKSFTIQRFPKILVIHLKRFSAADRYYRTKILTTVEAPVNNLDLSSCATPTASGSHVYNLYGIANHSGTVLSGHYFATCKHPYSGTWHHYNDQRVYKSSDNVITPEAYLLFYERSDHYSRL